MTDLQYKLYGYTMSPYSMKMRSYLRYRRIPFQWVTGTRANDTAMTKVDTFMVPVLENPEGVFKNDSTFLIDELEQRFPDRRAEPENEADSFLAYLIEDYADEWLLLPFFMHRWRKESDRLVNSKWILYEHLGGKTSDPTFDELAEGWAERQVKLVYINCGSEEMFEFLDDSLTKLLAVTESAFSNGLFLFGSRPSRAEFALYGMLSQLVIDATPSVFMREKYSYTYRWVTVMDDLSGSEGHWRPLAADIDRLNSSAIPSLLKLSSKYHLPLLQSNSEAIRAGEKKLSFDIEGRTFRRHASERYQHCLPTLRDRYQNLSHEAKDCLKDVLDETGCLDFLQ